MERDHLQVEELLMQISLFHGLGNHQIADLADRLEMVFLDEGEVLFKEGDPGDSLYIVYRGQVQVLRGGEALATLGAGDYFGEEALLYGRPRSATVVAFAPAALLRLSGEEFERLRAANPQFQPQLAATAESHELARQVRFSWLSPGEVVYLVARKHIARLWLALTGPFFLAVFSLPAFFLTYLTGTLTPSLLGGMILLAALLWGVWNAVDWGNDYYIITNQRVVWLERVVGLYESRQEAPLRTVLAVSLGTDQLGRILGYGDVIVRTYTGRIVMRHVGRPAEFASLVEQYWMRTRKKTEEAEADAMVRTLKRHLGIEDQEPAPEPTLEEAEQPVPEIRKPGLLNLVLANYFKLRYEEGSVITYRKHWFLLLTKIWQPSLGLLLVFLIMLARLVDRLAFLSWPTVLVVGIALLTALGAWWLYVYVDWRNDIFQLTPDHIVDIERKPLGSEEKKSAPLENILSLRHERQGIWGLLFNFGTVTARIGKAEFTFDSVSNPAQVQQDIFARMDERLRQRKEAEAARERERMAEWLAAYHRNLDTFQNAPPSPETDQE